MASIARFTSDRKAAQALRENLRTIPDNRLACRQYRHAWDDHAEFQTHVVKGSRTPHLRLEMSCMRGCGVILREIYIVTRASGIERVQRVTDYSGAKGYLFPGVPRGVKPLTILQQERYRRSMERAAKAKPGQRETAER